MKTKKMTPLEKAAEKHASGLYYGSALDRVYAIKDFTSGANVAGETD